MKQYILLFLFSFLLLGTLPGQESASVPLGINYQAVARDAKGLPLANQSLNVRISLTSADASPKVYFQEEHKLQTDDLGLFQLVIGRGNQSDKTLMDVPWAGTPVWMDVEIARDNGEYRLVSSTQLLSAPYAFHARQAVEMGNENNPDLRNQSIRWLTSGNKESRPTTHFLGTRDAKDLIVKTNDTKRAAFTAEGQFKVFSGVGANGTDDDINDYPVTIEGSRQGIYIKVNGSRTGNNNYLSFADTDTDLIWGRVEGQTTAEFLASSDFIRTTAFFAAQAVIFGLKVGAAFAKAAGFAASIFGAGAAPIEAAQAAQLILDGIGIAGSYASWLTAKLTSIGVVYSSGNGDYAEYLLRAQEVMDLLPGEVVGVKGGVVSRNTLNADHIMVISTAPIISASAPQKSEEHLYEKVAFMGQVPVRIAGPVEAGDYIIPSGNNDGLGLAVKPENMLGGDFQNAVGVAWESKPDATLNVVNVAVGINTNDLSEKAALLNYRVDNIMNYLEGKAPLIKDEADLLSINQVNLSLDETKKATKSLSDEAFDDILDENAGAFVDVFEKTKKILERQGYDWENSPEARALFEDPLTYLKDLRRDPTFQTQWSVLDQQLKKLSEDE